jgi:hypothetical protein
VARFARIVESAPHLRSEGGRHVTNFFLNALPQIAPQGHGGLDNGALLRLVEQLSGRDQSLRGR